MIPEANEVPILVAQSGPLQGSHWRLEGEAVLIGRGEDCDIVAADRQISRYHARVKRTSEGFVVEDLGSKNGTHLNGVLLRSPSPLQDGDVIQVAFALELAYVGREATMPLSPLSCAVTLVMRTSLNPLLPSLPVTATPAPMMKFPR